MMDVYDGYACMSHKQEVQGGSDNWTKLQSHDIWVNFTNKFKAHSFVRLTSSGVLETENICVTLFSVSRTT